MSRGWDKPMRSLMQVMRRKMRANVHKSRWIDESPDWLLERLRAEVGELEDAISLGNPDEVLEECADVANFAMMIADIFARM